MGQKQSRGAENSSKHSDNSGGPVLSRDEVNALERESEALTGSAVVASVEPPAIYESRERGQTIIDTMAPIWAHRAADAVARGDRPEDSPAVIKPLRKRAREV
jgi:hypothetical protein